MAWMGQLQVGADYLIVRQTLAAQRRAGADFTDAWKLAMRMARKEDRNALRETRGAWERAYNREGFYSGASFSMLADVGDEHHDTARQLAV
jgi:hypothetical protein